MTKKNKIKLFTFGLLPVITGASIIAISASCSNHKNPIKLASKPIVIKQSFNQDHQLVSKTMIALDIPKSFNNPLKINHTNLHIGITELGKDIKLSKNSFDIKPQDLIVQDNQLLIPLPDEVSKLTKQQLIKAKIWIIDEKNTIPSLSFIVSQSSIKEVPYVIPVINSFTATKQDFTINFKDPIDLTIHDKFLMFYKSLDNPAQELTSIQLNTSLDGKTAKGTFKTPLTGHFELFKITDQYQQELPLSIDKKFSISDTPSKDEPGKEQPAGKEQPGKTEPSVPTPKPPVQPQPSTPTPAKPEVKMLEESKLLSDVNYVDNVSLDQARLYLDPEKNEKIKDRLELYDDFSSSIKDPYQYHYTLNMFEELIKDPSPQEMADEEIDDFNFNLLKLLIDNQDDKINNEGLKYFKLYYSMLNPEITKKEQLKFTKIGYYKSVYEIIKNYLKSMNLPYITYTDQDVQLSLVSYEKLADHKIKAHFNLSLGYDLRTVLPEIKFGAYDDKDQFHPQEDPTIIKLSFTKYDPSKEPKKQYVNDLSELNKNTQIVEIKKSQLLKSPSIDFDLTLDDLNGYYLRDVSFNAQVLYDLGKIIGKEIPNLEKLKTAPLDYQKYLKLKEKSTKPATPLTQEETQFIKDSETIIQQLTEVNIELNKHLHILNDKRDNIAHKYFNLGGSFDTKPKGDL